MAKKNQLQKLNSGVVMPFANGNELTPAWEVWKEFKWKEFKFRYKSEISEQAALNHLFNLSQGDIQMAKNIMMQSMSNGWKGMFPLQKSYIQTLKENKQKNELEEIRRENGLN